MSRRDTITALLAEHAHCSSSVEVVESGRGILHYPCGAVVTEVRGLRRADFAHVADVIDRAFGQDEPASTPESIDRDLWWGYLCPELANISALKAAQVELMSLGVDHGDAGRILSRVQSFYVDAAHAAASRYLAECQPALTGGHDEPRQDEGGDREALRDALGSGVLSKTLSEVADAVLAWMRDQGFRRHPEVEGTTVTEWGLIGSDGTYYDGADEGLRWTREQVEVARDADPVDGVPDRLICREVTTTPDRVTDWTEVSDD